MREFRQRRQAARQSGRSAVFGRYRGGATGTLNRFGKIDLIRKDRRGERVKAFAVATV